MDRNLKPMVTVVIPSYNYAHYVGSAIKSCLAQTLENIELIVVDDGSTDNTAEVVAEFPSVKYHRQLNKGLACARNTGAMLSTSPYLLFLDADDLLQSSALSNLHIAISRNDDIAFVAGRHQYIDKNGELIDWEPLPPRYKSSVYKSLLEHNFIACPAGVLFNKAFFQRCGGFDDSVPGCEDYDLYLRLAMEQKVVLIDEPVSLYRQHGESMSGNAEIMLASVLEVVKRQELFVNNSNGLRHSHRKGLRAWSSYYGTQAARQQNKKIKEGFFGYVKLFHLSPLLPIKCLIKTVTKKTNYREAS